MNDFFYRYSKCRRKTIDLIFKVLKPEVKNAFISVIEWPRISAWPLMWGDELTLSQSDLYAIFPFGKEKVLKFLNSGELPAVKVGKDYITTFNLLEKWTEEHVGEEIYY